MYLATLEAILRFARLNSYRRAINWGLFIICYGMLVEMFIVMTQAARGVQSHFNVSTPLDTFLFSIMGIIITMVTIVFFLLGLLIYRQSEAISPFAREVIFAGFVMTTLGSFQGFKMTQPTLKQLNLAEKTGVRTLSGDHFVGDPTDSTHRKLSFLGWSLQVGDLRIAHFIGLHGLQFFLLLGLFLHFIQGLIGKNLKYWIFRMIVLGYFSFFLFTHINAIQGNPLL
jgi:hypothetical protein